MTEKIDAATLTPEQIKEHEDALKLAEQLVYSGGLSTEMIKHATRLENWEVLDIEHDVTMQKYFRLQQLRNVCYDIDDDNTNLDRLQEELFKIATWSQMLLYNRRLTEIEKEALRDYCTYEDASAYEELKTIACYASLPDAEFIHKIHTYINDVYAHILRHNFDAEQ